MNEMNLECLTPLHVGDSGSFCCKVKSPCLPSWTGDADDSLAPPPLDSRLSISDRLAGIQSVLDLCQGKQLSQPCVVTFDIKDQYKVLAQGCGVTLKGEFQDPKVACWVLDPGAKEKPLHRLVNNLLPSEVHLLEGLCYKRLLRP